MVDPTQRFTGLADIYSQARPSYPEDAIDYICRTAGLTKTSLIADIGCGTGISSRLFYDRGYTVIGIEPNADMRYKAQESFPEIDYREGTAEATEMPDSSVDLVLAAQAFHWFDPDRAFPEFRRIINFGGWVALMWNERDERDAFTRGYGDVLRMTPETAKVEGHRGSAGEPLLTCKLFTSGHKVTFANSQRLDENGVLARAFSASYTPKDEPGMTTLRNALKELFAKFQKDGTVQLIYETSVYMAQRLD